MFIIIIIIPIYLFSNNLSGMGEESFSFLSILASTLYNVHLT